MTLTSDKVKTGEQAPDFCLPEGLTDKEICLSDYRGRVVLVIFLKGSW
ncbi:MAG: peroxiredoxin family protein [Actinomycetota bacterium]